MDEDEFQPQDDEIRLNRSRLFEGDDAGEEAERAAEAALKGARGRKARSNAEWEAQVDEFRAKIDQDAQAWAEEVLARRRAISDAIPPPTPTMVTSDFSVHPETPFSPMPPPPEDDRPPLPEPEEPPPPTIFETITANHLGTAETLQVVMEVPEWVAV